MGRNKPRTNATSRLTLLAAIGSAASVSLATENAALSPSRHPLTVAPIIAAPAPNPDDVIEWDLPALPLFDAAQLFAEHINVQVVVDAYDMQLPVGPFKGRFTPREIWSTMMDAACAETEISETGHTYSAHPKPILGLNDSKQHYDLPSATLWDRVNQLAQTNHGMRFSLAPRGNTEIPLEPIQGYLTLEEALQGMIAQIPIYTYMYYGVDDLALAPKETVPQEKDLMLDNGKARLCLARKPPSYGNMLVTATRLPTFSDEIAGSVIVLDRRRIEEIGASSVPELLQYLPQSAFSSSAGYRLNGAQYAEGRGVGPAMVLIEQKRTMASANSISDSAFDLNSIPLAAIERIEYVPDAGSIVYGVDSVGGIVNIVLRQPPEGLATEVRYGSARGGAIERRATGIARTASDAGSATLIADYLEVEDLLGNTRSRYVNQDYRRYGNGGRDRRSLSSAPGNFRSLDGRSNLPGFDTPIVGLPAAGWGDSLDPSELSTSSNLTSLLQYQSIAPARSRKSLVGTATMPLGIFQISGDAIYTQQETQYTLMPPTIQGLPIAPDHPQNPLHIPLRYYGLLTGIPSQRYETSSELYRGAATIGVHLLGWDWNLSLVGTRESFDAWTANEANPLKVADALFPSPPDPDSPHSNEPPVPLLDILAPSPGDGRTDLLAPRTIQRSLARASQAHFLGERDLPFLAAGNARMRVGAEWHQEDIDFDEVDGAAKRTTTASFLNLQIPIVHSLEVSAGARHDRNSDGNSVTSGQYGFSWVPIGGVKFYGDYGQRFRPPSLYELHQSTISMSMPILDPKTNETTVATISAGGRQDLEPTTATSGKLGVAIKLSRRWTASVDYWQVEVEDRIDTLPLLVTLVNEDYLPGVVTRGPPLSDDVPGPIQTINVGWQNLGELRATGFDFNVRGEIDLWSGKLTPELGVTLNKQYSFRDLPPEISALIDRVGEASALGTISDYRAVGSLTWENDSWRLTTNVRHHPRYRDSDPGIASLGIVSSQTLVDSNAAFKLGNAKVTAGVLNLFDTEPAYSSVSSWGYDPSQGELRGRFYYTEVKFEF